MTKYCANCGKELKETYKVCPNCGHEIIDNKAEIKQENNNQMVNQSEQNNAFAITGFILSLLSFFCCGVTSLPGLIFSIVGLVNHKKYNNVGKGLAIAGIVISAIMIFLVIFLYILFFAGVYTIGSTIDYY